MFLASFPYLSHLKLLLPVIHEIMNLNCSFVIYIYYFPLFHFLIQFFLSAFTMEQAIQNTLYLYPCKLKTLKQKLKSRKRKGENK